MRNRSALLLCAAAAIAVSLTGCSKSAGTDAPNSAARAAFKGRPPTQDEIAKSMAAQAKLSQNNQPHK
jgi:hypothetical protein